MDEKTEMAALMELMANMKNAAAFEKKKMKENTEELNTNLNSFINNVDSNMSTINKFVRDYNQQLCSCKAAFTDTPLNPLERAVMSSTEVFTEFLLSNDPSKFFIPEMQQKATVILDFLSHILIIIEEKPQLIPWMECALLDFDTQDRRIKNTAPQVLNQVRNKVSLLNSPESRMILHLVRSLLLDFKE